MFALGQFLPVVILAPDWQLLSNETRRDRSLVRSSDIPVIRCDPTRASDPVAGLAGTSSDVVARVGTMGIYVVDTEQ